jgi:hypothetical protein
MRPRQLEGGFIVLDEVRLAATRAGRQRLNAVLAETRIAQGPKLLAWFLTTKPELPSTAQVSRGIARALHLFMLGS